MTKNCFLFAWFLVLRERVNPVPVFHHPQQGKSIFFKLCSVSQHIVEVYIFIAKAVFLKIGKMGKNYPQRQYPNAVIIIFLAYLQFFGSSPQAATLLLTIILTTIKYPIKRSKQLQNNCSTVGHLLLNFPKAFLLYHIPLIWFLLIPLH